MNVCLRSRTITSSITHARRCHQLSRKTLQKLEETKVSTNGLLHPRVFHPCLIKPTSTQQSRALSTTTTNTEDNKGSGDQDGDLVFYERSPTRSLFPRASLGLSTLHSIYWTWYVADFIPALNKNAEIMAGKAAANAIPATEAIQNVDASLGYLGLGVALTINFFAAMYPSALITKISLGGSGKTQDGSNGSGQLKVWTYKLPFITMGTTPKLYPIGDLYLDPANAETKRIVDDHDGYVEFFRGIMTLRQKSGGNFSSPLMLEVRDDMEAIQNPDLFMRAMLDPSSESFEKALRDQQNNKMPAGGKKLHKKKKRPRQQGKLVKRK